MFRIKKIGKIVNLYAKIAEFQNSQKEEDKSRKEEPLKPWTLQELNSFPPPP